MMMKKTLVLLIVLLVSGLFGISSVQAEELSGSEILSQVDKNLQPQSYEMYRKLINVEPDGSKKEFVLYSMKKGQDKIGGPVFVSGQ